MKISNIYKASSWFEVLDTTSRSQTAVMTLEPGAESGPEAESHKDSDQAILLLSGVMRGTIDTETVTLEAGDTIIIPAGTQHRFWNEGEFPAVSFSVYSPPEYDANEKG